ncbi:SDR family oxidoreductase [Danxiaibacter flavus]|uniref:SDR family oxidoreductase n=1 Tax=Danxiaibacter flavus TaxID=3049108 RepID=A0ABV3ZFP5_9BACT|nr:SDR family oxidoreductase [Chitinophagaceae bacterium DXS]
MIIVITGASKGLGKAIAEKFAADEEQHTIILNARNTQYLDELRSSLSQNFSHQEVVVKQCDMSLKEEVLAFASFVSDHGTPDILINNAGSFIPGSVYNEPEGALEEMMNVNLFSAYHLTRALLPAMMEQRRGHIFNMCSIASLKAYANGGAYSISKFALAGFSKNLREELKPYNIKVTSVYPGAAYTDSWSGSGVDPKRIMEAKDIADVVHTSAYLSPTACVEDIILRPQLGDL